jgi:hypothetical protein
VFWVTPVRYFNFPGGILRRFFWRGSFAFLQGVFEKTGGWTWFFDGEFVVEAW